MYILASISLNPCTIPERQMYRSYIPTPNNAPEESDRFNRHKRLRSISPSNVPASIRKRTQKDLQQYRVAETKRRPPRCVLSTGNKELMLSDEDEFDDALHEFDSCHTIGSCSVVLWQNTSGRSKSWSVCPKVSVKRKGRRAFKVSYNHQFHMSPLWLPQAFVRSQQDQTAQPRAKLIRLVKPHDVSSKTAKFTCQLLHEVAEAVHCDAAPLWQPTQATNKDTAATEHEHSIPGTAFIRFTWTKQGLVNGVGELDHFLTTGLLLRSRWRIQAFKRKAAMPMYTLPSTTLFAHRQRHQR
jgi:hypothetical protein